MNNISKIITIIVGGVVFALITISCIPERYDCSRDIYDCADFERQSQAQEVLDYCLKNTGLDIHNLDPNLTGKACQSLFD